MQAGTNHSHYRIQDLIGFIHIYGLYAQDYCEYQLYLEHVKDISVYDAPEMVTGSNEHQRLEDAFLIKAEDELILEEAVFQSFY